VNTKLTLGTLALAVVAVAIPESASAELRFPGPNPWCLRPKNNDNSTREVEHMWQPCFNTDDAPGKANDSSSRGNSSQPDPADNTAADAAQDALNNLDVSAGN
jgi:hypothetical protein